MSMPVSVPQNGGKIEANLRYMQWRSVSVYFFDYPPFYDRDGLYGKGGKDHADNDRRFALFSRGVLEGAKAAGFKPDVIHGHDWQTGLIPAYLKRVYANDSFFSGTASVLTIHNMAYQGNFPPESLSAAGFPADEFSPERSEFYGKASFLKAGLVYADQLTTVSPTYAREITESSERGFGLEGLLRARQKDLTGILNGLDLEIWNPERDSAIAEKFSAKDPKGKTACRAALRKECGLEDSKKPLIGVVSRLDHQKGLDLAISALSSRLDKVQLVVLGTGDPALESAFRSLAEKNPRSVKLLSGFDEALAHRVYAGSDLFLMPSRFEPCGLGQMIAMRYGAVPVASATGGLADTIEDGVNGFLCKPDDAAGLGVALDRALNEFSGKGRERLVSSAMKSLFPWDKSVEEYLRVYARAASAVQAARA
jgi:starch synthase